MENRNENDQEMWESLLKTKFNKKYLKHTHNLNIIGFELENELYIDFSNITGIKIDKDNCYDKNRKQLKIILSKIRYEMENKILNNNSEILNRTIELLGE